MKSTLSFALLFLFSITCFSQRKPKVVERHYTPLEVYHETYKTPLTKKDSLNFIVRNDKTLVLITKKMKTKGTYVDYVFKDSTFLNQYKKVAFNHKSDSIDNETSMKYWKKDIKLFFAKSISKKEKKSILSFAKEISKKVDSLHIYEAKNHSDSNYTIYYSSDYEYDVNLKKYNNANFWVYWYNNNQLYKGAIKINNEKYFSESLRIAKIKELLFQSLGYFELSNELNCNSYFSNCFSENKQITDFDYELLQYHYCYGICKGTSLGTFEAQHESVKETMSKHTHSIHRFHYPDN
ncbi:hypothetical protein [Psychroserpens damuponensis]|uniref:hypothetical protein n=1 Tax=Psychroserpens damuponensis TaxID=943936 RepID=UPI00058BDF87|nr:hypothetical protein [Psychroserpens damuponensis]